MKESRAMKDSVLKHSFWRTTVAQSIAVGSIVVDDFARKHKERKSGREKQRT